MISIRKLESLPRQTRRRKVVRLLESWVAERMVPDPAFADALAALVEADGGLPDAVTLAAVELRARLREGGVQTSVRSADRLRHALMGYLGVGPADWDLLPPARVRGTGAEEEPERTPLAAVVLYLESIRSPFNAGSLIRTASAFGLDCVAMSEDCPPFEQPRLIRSAMGATASVALRRESLAAFAAGVEGPCIALELGGTPCDRYSFPRRGALLVGSEELGLSPEALDVCEARVTVPLYGAKASLNVGVACGIALAFWAASLRD